jgi:hypothetical protein
MKVALGMLQRTVRGTDPTAPEESGNGISDAPRLYTVAGGSGWAAGRAAQGRPHGARRSARAGLTGFIRCELRPNTRATTLPLADRYHVPHPTVDLATRRRGSPCASMRAPKRRRCRDRHGAFPIPATSS